jgi:hypothetical protein
LGPYPDESPPELFPYPPSQPVPLAEIMEFSSIESAVNVLETFAMIVEDTNEREMFSGKIQRL